MAKVNAPLLAFSAGEVSSSALARVDVERLRLAAQVQVNWAPTVVGAQSLRGGLQYLGSTKSDAPTLALPFVFGTNDAAVLELTANVLRVWKNDALISRVAVATVVTNGDFSSSAGWTLSATSGCTADINVTVAGMLYLAAVARGGLVSCLRQVTVAGGDLNKAHALRIVVNRGPVTFMVGSTSGGSEYVARTTLRTGTHSIAFTPTGDFYVKFESSLRRGVIVDSIAVEAAGTLELPTPWGAVNLDFIRPTQSADIVFVACDGVAPYQIERRANDSWSVVLFQNDLGPFALTDTQGVTLTPSVYEGNGTLVCSGPLFSAADVGRLYRLSSAGQTRQAILGAADAVSESYRNAGIGPDRGFSWTVSGTWVGTLALERSVDGPNAGFKQVSTVTVNGTTNVDDTGGTTPATAGYNNVVVWYRIRFKTYTSGSAVVSFGGTVGSEGAGAAAVSQTLGICRVTTYTSQTQVSIEVLKPFAEVTASTVWEAGSWGTGPGYPPAIELAQGRLFAASRDVIDSSVSDDYTNFDDTVTGDSGPISRTIGSKEVDTINWLLPLRRLIIGCEGSEVALRSSSFDEPLTPTNAIPDACSTQGSTNLPALKVDTRGVFVERSGRRVYELAYSVEAQDYAASDLTKLNLDIGVPGFRSLAVQRQPDTRMHFVRGDGQDAILLRAPADEIICWTRTMTLGVIERVCVLPGALEDSVYYVVKRTINGATKRFFEKQARRDQCVGGSLNRQADAFVVISQASSTTITGLAHLEGESVVVWGNGKSLGSYTVTGGQITGVVEAVSSAIVGLGGVRFAYDGAASTSVTVGTKYNGYPTELFASRSTGGKLRYVGTVTVAAGLAMLPDGKTAAKIVAFLGYMAPYMSAKLAYGAQKGTALTQRKKIDGVGLIAHDLHPQGLQVGQTFEQMDDLPLIEEGAAVDQNEIWDDYDADITSVPGEWDTDARLCLLAQAPKPVTLSAVVLAMATNER